MKKQGSGFGFFILLIVLVVVLLLATRAWKAVMPTALQAVKPGASQGVPDHGQTGAGEALRSGNLPDLKKMGQNTDQHVKQVNEAAKGQD
jgi:hypothetical protein